VRFEVLTVVLDETQVFWDVTSLVPIMSQINSVHSFPSCFFKIHFYYYLSICAWVLQLVSFLQDFQPKHTMPFSLIHAIFLAYLILLASDTPFWSISTLEHSLNALLCTVICILGLVTGVDV